MQGTARNDDALVDDRLVITVLVGCLLFLGVGLSRLSVDHTRGAVPASIFALATAGVLGVVTLVLWRRPGVITPRNAVWAVTFTAIVVGANPVVYTFCTGIAYPSIGTLLLIVGIGALVPYPRVAAALILTLNVIAVLCAIRYPQAASVGLVAMQLLKADLLAVIIAVTWRRTERRLRDANETIRQMAVTDDMTDLLNRRGFIERGGRYLNDAEHRGRHLLLAFVDIDGLKQINDSQGHAAGDVIITAVGGSLHWVLDDGDVAARIGGDEFAVLMAADDADTVRALQTRLEQGLRENGHPVTVGWVHHEPGYSGTLESLIAESDLTMLSMKRSNPGF
ncbi:GGDEF domain-containing protein [Gordonia sp. NPDC003504]